MIMKEFSLIVFSVCICFNISFAQVTINVPDDYASIQEALDIAIEGTTIKVAPGIYYENLIWPENVDGIELIGTHGRDETFIDGQSLGRVILMQGSQELEFDTLPKAKIDGFTIQNGRILVDEGAGMFVHLINPTLVNLKFTNNTILDSGQITGPGCGAGLYLKEFKGVIEDCEFTDNKIEPGLSAFGAGCYIDIIGKASIIDCKFSRNECRASNFAQGGGLSIRSNNDQLDSLKVNVINCRFENNLTVASSILSKGAAINISQVNEISVNIDSCIFRWNKALDGVGGAISINGYNSKISNCLFIENYADQGAAIYSNYGYYGSDRIGYTTISNSIFRNNLTNSLSNARGVIHTTTDPVDFTINNCLFNHNKGAPLRNYDGGPTTEEKHLIKLNHCTFAYNEEPIDLDEIDIYASNSIFWENGEEEILVYFPVWNESEIKLQNCIVKNGYEGENIFDVDPMFKSMEDFKPSVNSPCINAGIISELNIDLNGKPRPMPVNSNPDIGAYEVDLTTTQVKENHFARTIFCFPNPTADFINISPQVDHLKIYNTQSKLVYETQNTSRVDLSDFKIGVYFVELIIGGITISDKWVISR